MNTIIIIILIVLLVAVAVMAFTRISSLTKEKEALAEEKNSLKTQVEVRDNELRNKSAAMESETARLQQHIDELKAETVLSLQRAKEEADKQLLSAKEEWKQTSQQALDAKQKACDDAIAAMETRHNEAIKTQEKIFNETMAKVIEQAKNATGEMIKKSQKDFSESSNTNLGNIINPLMQNMKDMREAMDNNRNEQTKMGADMNRHIQSLMESAAAARTSANELAEAFRHRPKSQGNWGERKLNELLDSQGLVRGVDYETQVTLKDKDGVTIVSDKESAMMPDVILHLDQVRDVIIDSKVSLTAYTEYVNAETEAEKDAYLKDHISSVWGHVTELSKKNYDTYVKAPHKTMDYVIMFVPHSAALWTALSARPDMWRKAMEMGVYIADEQTLYAALRIISMTWTQIRQMDNQKKVFECANEMLKRVGMFWDQYKSIGKALESATKAYNEGEKKIKDGGQSISTTAKQLIKLGAKEDKKYVLGSMLDVDDVPSIEYNDITD